MNRRELVRLGWRESSLAYLEKHLQGLKDPQPYQEQYQSVFFLCQSSVSKHVVSRDQRSNGNGCPRLAEGSHENSSYAK